MDSRTKLVRHAESRERLHRQETSEYASNLAAKYAAELKKRLAAGEINQDQLVAMTGSIAAKLQFEKRRSWHLRADMFLVGEIVSADLYKTRAERDELQQHLPGMTRRELATRGAHAKLDRDSDGKQAVKRAAKELYKRWQDRELRFRSIAEFARYVVSTLGGVESPKTVEKWVREWRKETEPS